MIQQGHNLHTELHAELERDPNYQARYHKSCVTKYLMKAKRLSEKQASLDPSPLPEKRTRSNIVPPPLIGYDSVCIVLDHVILVLILSTQIDGSLHIL